MDFDELYVEESYTPDYELLNIGALRRYKIPVPQASSYIGLWMISLTVPLVEHAI